MAGQEKNENVRTLKQLSQKKSSTFSSSVQSVGAHRGQPVRESQVAAVERLKLKPESPPTPMHEEQMSPSRDLMGSTATRIVIVHKQSGLRDSTG